MSVAVYADHGLPAYNGADTLEDLGRVFSNITFILHPGDIGYADDAFLHVSGAGGCALARTMPCRAVPCHAVTHLHRTHACHWRWHWHHLGTGTVQDPFAFGYEVTWDQYFGNMTQFFRQKPVMVSPGNHEAECHSLSCLTDAKINAALGNFSAYNHR